MTKEQKSLWNLQPIASDVVYTPEHVAVEIIDWCKPSGVCLDPCAGDFVFYNNLPSPKHWCEIERGVDFFDWKEPVDWIIGNPPYSIKAEWIRHSYTISDNIVYLLPLNTLFNSSRMLKEAYEYGGIVGIKHLGSGGSLGFPFGYACGAVYIQRNYRGRTLIEP